MIYNSQPKEDEDCAAAALLLQIRTGHRWASPSAVHGRLVAELMLEAGAAPASVVLCQCEAAPSVLRVAPLTDERKIQRSVLLKMLCTWGKVIG